MTARSPRGGRRDFPASFFTGNTDLDAYIARDVLANNLLHCADEGGAPVFANTVVPKTSLIPSTPVQYRSALAGFSSVYPNDWVAICTFGPFFVPTFSDLTPYRMRVALFGATGAGSATDFFVRFMSDVGASAPGIEYGGGGSGDGLTFTTSSATPSWITATEGTDVVTISAGVLDNARARAPLPTLDDTGGVAAEASVCSIYAMVYGRSVGKGADKAQLFGLHVAAYVG